MTSSIRAGLTVFRMTGGHTPTVMVELVRTVLAEAAAAAGRLHPGDRPELALERAADTHFAIDERATIGNTLLLVGGERRSGWM